MKPLKKVNRVEVIDSTKPLEEGGGRTVLLGGPAYNELADKEVAVSFQDEGRTLKIFISAKGTTGVENTESDIPDWDNMHQPTASMATDDIIDDIDYQKPDPRNFRVDRDKPTMELEGVTGQEELSPNEE